MEKVQPYEYYEARRKYPRVIVNCPINIQFKEQVFTTTVHDVSMDGLQVRCDHKTIQAIRPSGKFIKKNNAPIMDVEFSLSIGKKNRKVKATGEMYYFVLLPDEAELNVAFGLKFIKFSKGSDKYIDEFIIDVLAPIEDKILDFLDEQRLNSEITEHTGMESHDVNDILYKLINSREIVSIDTGVNTKYIRFNTAIKHIFEKYDELEQRLCKLEKDRETGKT